MIIYSLDVLLSQFWTSLLFHVWFQLLLIDLHTAFSRGIPWYYHLVFPPLEEFSTVCCDPHSQRLSQSQQSRRSCFLELPCFLNDPMDMGNLNSGSSVFSKPMYIWKFSVHVHLKPSLKSFEHYLTSMWNECSCMVVWTFFHIALLWNWNENWPFPVLWSLLRVPNLLTYLVQHFNIIIF